jgi:uncharacterized protein YxeA
MFQCTLEKKSEEGRKVTVSWIPETFAKVGNYVKIKNEDEKWTDGWEITTVSKSSMSSEACNKLSQDHRGMATFEPNI